MIRHLETRALATLLACSVPLLQGGCATTWGLAKIISDKPPLEEKSREESVPLPGVTEKLGVVLHLEGKPVPPPTTTTPTPTPTPTPNPPAIPDPEIECVVMQTGKSEVYHAAIYYGRTWKWITGVSFLIEGAMASAFLLAGDKTTHYVYGAYWAADALVTGGLFFLPTRSSYEHYERESTVTVRHDCPEGLLIEVAGRPIPVDADGKLSPLALALIERHVTTVPEPIRVRMGAFGGELPLDPAVRCSWARRRSLPAADDLCKLAGANQSSTRADRSSPAVTLDVPLGLLTRAP